MIGASAGGVEALRALVAGLPGDLPATVLIVLHVPRHSRSALPAILSRFGPLPAAHAEDGEPLPVGQIRVAPSDHHLLVLDGRLRLSRGPAENGHRPAVDPLFRSAARSHGPGVIGVVLSGSRDDGTAGLAAIVARGGTGLVQDPADAMIANMPRSALEHVSVQRVLPADELGKAIAETVLTLPAPTTEPADALLDAETEMANMGNITTDKQDARPAGLGCPSCRGALFELPGAPAPRYRCRIGHAWSPESLLEEQAGALEGALWMALRALEEKAAFVKRMAESARKRGNTGVATRLDASSIDAHEASGLIRQLIDGRGAAGPDQIAARRA